MRVRALLFSVPWRHPGHPVRGIPGRLASARRRGTRGALQGCGPSSLSSQRRLLLRIKYGGPPRPGADEAAASPGQAAAAVPCSSLSRRRPSQPCQLQAHLSPRGSAGSHRLPGFRLVTLSLRRQPRWQPRRAPRMHILLAPRPPRCWRISAKWASDLFRRHQIHLRCLYRFICEINQATHICSAPFRPVFSSSR